MDEISERHRHRYEFNNKYLGQLTSAGLVISGLSPDGELVEIVELRDHPWFLGCQFHPSSSQHRGNRIRCSLRSSKRPTGTVNRGTNRDPRVRSVMSR